MEESDFHSLICEIHSEVVEKAFYLGVMEAALGFVSDVWKSGCGTCCFFERYVQAGFDSCTVTSLGVAVVESCFSETSLLMGYDHDTSILNYDELMAATENEMPRLFLVSMRRQCQVREALETVPFLI